MTTTTTAVRESINAHREMVASAAAAGHSIVFCAECGDRRSVTVSTTPSDRMALDFYSLRNHANFGHGRAVGIFGR